MKCYIGGDMGTDNFSVMPADFVRDDLLHIPGTEVYLSNALVMWINKQRPDPLAEVVAKLEAARLCGVHAPFIH
jgi:hypothetical protein